MNRRTALKIIPGALAMTAASQALMVPALGADAKSVNGAIELRNIWARASKSEDTTAYLDILNHGTTSDNLIAVNSPLAERCVLQKTHWSGLTMSTVAVTSISIPAMGRVRLTPGGTYIEILGLSQSLEGRNDLPLSLTFSEAGQIDVTAELTMRLLGPTRQN